MQEEILDIVDEHDQVIMQMPRSEAYATKKTNQCRVVHAFVINNQGEIWLPRRTAHKAHFASAWDFSCAGHVSAGEDYETAFRRELQEELGINLDSTTYKEVAYLNPHTSGVACWCFQKVYLIYSNDAPRYNDDDFAGYVWIRPSEAAKLIAMDPIIEQKSSLLPVLRYIFSV